MPEKITPPQDETENQDLVSINEYNKIIEDMAEVIVDEDGTETSVYTFTTKTGQSAQVVFYDSSETPHISEKVLKGKIGMIYGKKPDRATDIEWEETKRKIREYSQRTGENPAFETEALGKGEAVFYVANDPVSILNFALRIGANGSRETLKQLDYGNYYPDAKKFRHLLITLKSLGKAQVGLEKSNIKFMGEAKLILSLLGWEHSHMVSLETRYPGIFLLSYMPEVYDLAIAEDEAGAVMVEIESKDGYNMRYKLVKPSLEDFGGDREAFDKVGEDRALKIEDWKIYSGEYGEIDVYGHIKNLSERSLHEKSPNLIVETQIHRPQDIDWESLSDINYEPGKNDDRSIVRTAVIFSPMDRATLLSKAAHAKLYNNYARILPPIGDYSLEIVGHEIGHLMDSTGLKERDERERTLDALEKLWVGVFKKMRDLDIWFDKMREQNGGYIGKELLDEYERRKTLIERDEQEAKDLDAKFSEDSKGVTVERERNANANWLAWAKTVPFFKAKVGRTRSFYKFTLFTYAKTTRKKTPNTKNFVHLTPEEEYRFEKMFTSMRSIQGLGR